MGLKQKAIDLFDATKEPATEMACSLFLEGVAGTIIPGVMSSVLAYKQKRQERMFERFMIEMKDRLIVLEEKLIELDPDKFIEFKDKYFGLISDYALDEVQEEKIQYIANGFVNAAGIQELSEDFVLMYYDTLKELRVLDIGVLTFYYNLRYDYETSETYVDILQRFNIDYEQYNAIRERLLRLGLLTSKRDENKDNLYANILLLQETFEKTLKGNKVNNVRFKKLDKKDSLQISKFGREFVEFFTEHNQED